MLVAIDGSDCSLKAVDYVGRLFSGMDDIRITLLHVLPYVPTSFWDDGHILSRDEKELRKKVLDTWVRNQQLKVEPIFGSAVGLLTGRGIRPEQIETKAISDSTDVAETILEEARDGAYESLVMGRRGFSPPKRFLMGSVTAKVINHGVGVAICIVE